MQSSLDRFIRKRQAPAESNCGEEEECQEKEPKTTEDMEDSSSRKRYEEKRKQEGRSFSQALNCQSFLKSPCNFDYFLSCSSGY